MVLIGLADSLAERQVGRIILPAGTEKEDSQLGVILELGPDVDLEIKRGDWVIYSKFAGSPVMVGDRPCLLTEQKEILALVTELHDEDKDNQ